ncbi:glycosyltransferase family 2 protein [Candidatus Uhrbacteria bacterium]|jgi:glycosyltransferase involved in cell wall biosynthesis|nr:glycosyltransferase family 2 protein [Candidatus Uhrbacteria bacterium]
MTDLNPKISIVTTVYNGDAFLNDTLESLFQQDETDFEIIVVDDGSTDKTAEILAEWAQSHPRLRVFSSDHVGRVDALNEALGYARGKYVAISDADDLYRSDRLRIQSAFLDAHTDVGMVGSFAKTINETGEETGVIITAPTTHDEIVNIMIRYNPFVHSSVMYRHDVLDEVGEYSNRFIPGFEWEMYTKVIQRSKVANLPEQLVSYRRYSSSQTFRRSKLKRLCGVTRARWFVFRTLDYRWAHVPEVFMGLLDLLPEGARKWLATRASKRDRR